MYASLHCNSLTDVYHSPTTQWPSRCNRRFLSFFFLIYLDDHYQNSLHPPAAPHAESPGVMSQRRDGQGQKHESLVEQRSQFTDSTTNNTSRGENGLYEPRQYNTELHILLRCAGLATGRFTIQSPGLPLSLRDYKNKKNVHIHQTCIHTCCLRKLNIFVHSFTPLFPCEEINSSIIIHEKKNHARIVSKKNSHFLFRSFFHPFINPSYI